MKKYYEAPNTLFVSLSVEDVLTNSEGILFNNSQNADINSRDIRSFGSFFG